MAVNLGPTELIVILVIVLLLFGGAKLPKLARSLGQAQREFRQGVTEGKLEAEKDEEDKKLPPATDASSRDTPPA